MIVDGFEFVDIQHNSRERAVSADPSGEDVIQILAVVDADQRVDIRKFVLLHHKEPDESDRRGQPSKRKPVDQKLKSRPDDDGNEKDQETDEHPRAVFLFEFSEQEKDGDKIINDYRIIEVAEESALVDVVCGDDVRDRNEVVHDVRQNHNRADDDLRFIALPNAIRFAVKRKIDVHQKEEGQKHIRGEKISVDRVVQNSREGEKMPVQQIG